MLGPKVAGGGGGGWIVDKSGAAHNAAKMAIDAARNRFFIEPLLSKGARGYVGPAPFAIGRECVSRPGVSSDD
jgi:hypothetical protein